MLAKFLGYNQNCDKLANYKPLLDYIAANCCKASGLTYAEVNSLKALINNTSVPGNLSTVFAPARLRRDFHFLLRSDGRRATFFVGDQLNGNVSGDKATVYTAIFDRGTEVMDILHVTGKGKYACLDVSNRLIRAATSVYSCQFSSVWIPLPQDEPTHHFVWGPTGFRSCSNLACQ